jgi:hypothetical protein
MSTEIERRRKLVHRALAVGCGRWAPLLASGANGGTVATQMVAARELPGDVQSRTQPEGERRCALCAHFSAARNSCPLVAGPCGHQAGCGLWAQKA